MSALHVWTFGDPAGAPLLAVHGITGHGRRFEPLATTAWAHRRTLAVDLRGHGRSTADAPWSLGQLVADLVEVLDDAHLDAVDVVAHSYGGTIALQLLARHPERVRRLVLLDPALAQAGAWGEEAATETITDDGFATEDDARAWRAGALAPDDAIITAEVEHHLEQRADGRWWFRWHKPAVVTGWGEMASPVPVVDDARPTLLVIALQAELVGTAQRGALEAQLGEQLVTVELDCGHMLYWERPDEVGALVERFLA